MSHAGVLPSIAQVTCFDHSSLLLTGQGSTCLPPLRSLQETCQPAGAVSPASWLLPPTTARPHALDGVGLATCISM